MEYWVYIHSIHEDAAIEKIVDTPNLFGETKHRRHWLGYIERLNEDRLVTYPNNSSRITYDWEILWQSKVHLMIHTNNKEVTFLDNDKP